jgi:hypothetical protein
MKRIKMYIKERNSIARKYKDMIRERSEKK